MAPRLQSRDMPDGVGDENVRRRDLKDAEVGDDGPAVERGMADRKRLRQAALMAAPRVEKRSAAASSWTRAAELESMLLKMGEPEAGDQGPVSR